MLTGCHLSLILPFLCSQERFQLAELARYFRNSPHRKKLINLAALSFRLFSLTTVPPSVSFEFLHQQSFLSKVVRLQAQKDTVFTATRTASPNNLELCFFSTDLKSQLFVIPNVGKGRHLGYAQLPHLLWYSREGLDLWTVRRSWTEIHSTTLSVPQPHMNYYFLDGGQIFRIDREKTWWRITRTQPEESECPREFWFSLHGWKDYFFVCTLSYIVIHYHDQTRSNQFCVLHRKSLGVFRAFSCPDSFSGKWCANDNYLFALFVHEDLALVPYVLDWNSTQFHPVPNVSMRCDEIDCSQDFFYSLDTSRTKLQSYKLKATCKRKSAT